LSPSSLGSEVGSSSKARSGHKARFEAEDRSWVISLWSDRFGIPEEAFFGYSFYRMARNIWAFRGPPLPRMSFETVGLRIVSLKEDLWKPTTSAIQVFGSMATKNVVRLAERDAWEFMAGGTLEISADVEPGYVVVMSGEDILGCGLYSRGKLISQVPKDRRLQAEAGDILCS